MRSFEKVCALCVLVAICIDNAIALRNSSITLYPETNPLQIHLQKFVDQFSYDLSVEFLRKLPNAIVRSTATEFPILKSISNYPVTSVTVLIISAIFTYFISPFVSGEWVQQVTGIDVNFWENKIDEIGRNVKQALEATKNIDSDACIKMAMCEFGKRKESRDRGQQASVAINVVDYILQSVRAETWIETRKRYKMARDFGESGGDCDAFNHKHSCPLDAETWSLLAASVSALLTK